MATIPVEKKSGTPWWVWLLPLLLLGALLLFFLNRDDEEDAGRVVVEQTGPGSAGTAAGTAGAGGDGALADDGLADGADTAGGAASGTAGAVAGTVAGDAITDLDALYASDLSPLVGRRVELRDATVLSVTGDSTFYIGSGAERFLVALSGLGEAAEGPGNAGADGRFNIDPGDRVSVRGTVTRFDAANRAFGRLSEADRTEAEARGAFVNVTRADDVTSR